MTSELSGGEQYDDVVDSGGTVFLLSAAALVAALSIYHLGFELGRFRVSLLPPETLLARTPIETGISAIAILGGTIGSIAVTRFMVGRSILLTVPSNTVGRRTVQRLQIAVPAMIMFYAVLGIPHLMFPDAGVAGQLRLFKFSLQLPWVVSAGENYIGNCGRDTPDSDSESTEGI